MFFVCRDAAFIAAVNLLFAAWREAATSKPATLPVAGRVLAFAAFRGGCIAARLATAVQLNVGILRPVKIWRNRRRMIVALSLVRSIRFPAFLTAALPRYVGVSGTVLNQAASSPAGAAFLNANGAVNRFHPREILRDWRQHGDRHQASPLSIVRFGFSL